MVEFDDTFRQHLRELFVWRRDVRRFRADPLPAGAIDRLIETACLSPSVGLSQPWRFVVVEDAARRRAVIDDFRACNADALNCLFRRTRRALCDTKTVRSRTGPRSPRRVRGQGKRHRPRARPRDHAGDDGIFRGRRDHRDVARGARRRHRHRLGVDPQSGARSHRSRRARAPGSSSPISASAIRKSNATSRSSSRRNGNTGAARRNSRCGVEAPPSVSSLRPGVDPGCHPRPGFYVEERAMAVTSPRHDGERSDPRYDLLLPVAAATGAGLSCFWNINNGRKMTRP